MLRHQIALVYGFILLVVSEHATAASTALKKPESAPVPFSAFVGSLHQLRAEDFVNKPGYRVESASAFKRMREHLLLMTSGELVTHSFDLGGAIFDCVPVLQQPSARMLRIPTLATPPLQIPLQRHVPKRNEPKSVTTKLDGTLDVYGNPRRCSNGSVPVRRLTIQELARHRTLDELFRKAPPPSACAGSVHDFSHVYTCQTVSNLGSYSVINVWRPHVNFNLNEGHTLSQAWLTGGTGTGFQTVEFGWINGKYGVHAEHSTENSVMFIFWTANDYGIGSKNIIGCYDLDCPGFMQTNSNYCVGCVFPNYSTTQGTQYEVAVGFQLYQGNWWLTIGGAWVGYYPGSIFRGGQMTRNAQTILFGGETATNGTWWPFMGSGHYASTGFKSAAFQRLVQYWNLNGTLTTPSLTAAAPVPSCYTIAGPNSGGRSWGSYFFFGGPGGQGCQE